VKGRHYFSILKFLHDLRLNYTRNKTTATCKAWNDSAKKMHLAYEKLMSGEGDVLGHKDKVRVVLATFECIL